MCFESLYSLRDLCFLKMTKLSKMVWQVPVGFASSSPQVISQPYNSPVSSRETPPLSSRAQKTDAFSTHFHANYANSLYTTPHPQTPLDPARPNPSHRGNSGN